jgi:hypothetical protein
MSRIEMRKDDLVETADRFHRMFVVHRVNLRDWGSVLNGLRLLGRWDLPPPVNS